MLPPRTITIAASETALKMICNWSPMRKTVVDKDAVGVTKNASGTASTEGYLKAAKQLAMDLFSKQAHTTPTAQRTAAIPAAIDAFTVDPPA
jgi:hypothetical protein